MQASPRQSRPDEPTDAPHASGEGRPYGLVGLTIGLVLIVIVAVVLCVVVLGVAAGVTTLVVGSHRAFAMISGWREAVAGGDTQFVESAGIVLSLVFYAAMAVAVLLAALVRGRSRWRDIIGWRPWHPLRRSRLFWAIAAGTIVYGFVADAVVGRLYPPAKTWVTLPDRPIWAWLFVGLAVVFAPIAEELLFRGWIYTGLRRKIGVWEAVNVSAALFALAHWESTQIYALVVFPVGLALGYVRERTGSLKASMSFHAVYNAAASALMLFGP